MTCMPDQLVRPSFIVWLLTHFWTKPNILQTANEYVYPPLMAFMPNQFPAIGEYGRLVSQRRVRSHLETTGQPKAGTVTITQP